MAGETTITMIGNLTADPEVKTTSAGKPVASFTVASTPRSFNRETNQWDDGQALFLRCSAWGHLADHAAQSLAKGMRVIVTGRLSQRSYQAKDGSQRTSIDLTVDEIGPSLRYATAQVVRAQSGNGGFQQRPQQRQQSQARPQQPDPWCPSSGYQAASAGSEFAGGPDDPAF